MSTKEKQLLKLIHRDAKAISNRFNLKYLDITKEHPNVRNRYGSCDEDRVIRLLLQDPDTGRFLRYSKIIDTLCHEMAHLKHMDHSNNFKYLEEKIQSWAWKRGIHRSPLKNGRRRNKTRRS